MKAAIYVGPENVQLQEKEKPVINDGEALIKVEYSGVCGSDLFIYSGKHPRAKAPLIIGHEFSGVIEELKTDKETNLKVGDSVVVMPTYSCNECFACKEGFGHVCANLKLFGIDSDGSFAEYVKIPIKKIYPIPRQLDLKIASLVEPLAVAVHAVRRTALKAGDTVVIMGAGPIGILIGNVAKISGASKVYICDQNAYRLSVASEFGLRPINVNEYNAVERIKEDTNGRMADVAIDCAGVETTALSLTKLAKVRGQIMIVASFKEPTKMHLLDIEFKELDVIGTRVYEDRDYIIAIEMLKEHKELEKIITEYPLDNITEGINSIINGEDVIKVVFKI